jgi:hypothetical protein
MMIGWSWVWEEVVTYLKALSQNSGGEADENHEKPVG